MWQTVLAVVVVAYSLGPVVCLETNGIRSSKEILESSAQPARAHPGDTAERGARSRSETSVNFNRHQRTCSTSKCRLPEREGCSNRSQRSGVSPQDRQSEAWVDRLKDRPTGTAAAAEGNRTRGSCVRSGDCELGFCCVRYLTGKRCQRIPLDGDACLLPGRSKRRRNLERCHCGPGLYCSAVGLAEVTAVKKQGVCLPRPKQHLRNSRHSGKKRRTAEDGC